MISLPSTVVGTWLLDRFCGEPAIAGDLLQEYRAGRSMGWYWREVVCALCVYSVSTIWEHKWLTIRAVATGWVFSMIVIRTGMREIVHPWWDGVAPPALYPCIAYVPWLLNGWLVGRLHRPYSTAMVSAYAIWLVARSVGPIYSAGVDAVAGVQVSAFLWELSSRLSTVFVMMCGGALCGYRDQLATKCGGAQGGTVCPMTAAEG
jgi:hypothetical protein